MTHMAQLYSISLLAIVCFAAAGCSPAAPPPTTNQSHKHDDESAHHEHPETYAAAVTEIEELRTAVKDALAADDMEKADGPVHELGHILEDVPGLAEKASLGTQEQAEIKEAVEVLLDSFSKIDDKIHSGKGSTYEEVSSQIDDAMAKLRKHVPADK